MSFDNHAYYVNVTFFLFMTMTKSPVGKDPLALQDAPPPPPHPVANPTHVLVTINLPVSTRPTSQALSSVRETSRRKKKWKKSNRRAAVERKKREICLMGKKERVHVAVKLLSSRTPELSGQLPPSVVIISRGLF